MTPTARRQVIEILTTEHPLSVRRACRVAGLARAAWYVPPPIPAVRDAAVIEVLQGLVGEHTRWGFRKCYDRLRLDGYRWNHKRVHRVYCALRLNLPRRTRRRVPLHRHEEAGLTIREAERCNRIDAARVDLGKIPSLRCLGVHS